jgi:hypothetical protein
MDFMIKTLIIFFITFTTSLFCAPSFRVQVQKQNQYSIIVLETIEDYPDLSPIRFSSHHITEPTFAEEGKIDIQTYFDTTCPALQVFGKRKGILQLTGLKEGKYLLSINSKVVGTLCVSDQDMWFFSLDR